MSQEVRDQQIGAIIQLQNFTREQMNDVVKIDSSLAAITVDVERACTWL
jgi:hypothetical protein